MSCEKCAANEAKIKKAIDLLSADMDNWDEAMALLYAVVGWRRKTIDEILGPSAERVNVLDLYKRSLHDGGATPGKVRK